MLSNDDARELLLAVIRLLDANGQFATANLVTLNEAFVIRNFSREVNTKEVKIQAVRVYRKMLSCFNYLAAPDQKEEWKQFAAWAMTKIRPDLTPEQLLCNMAMGVAGEGGELCDLVKKEIFHNKPRDVDAVRKECGDITYYLTVMMNLYGITWDEVREENQRKLNKRFPNGFAPIPIGAKDYPDKSSAK